MDLILATRNQGKIDEMRPMLADVGFNLVNQSDTNIPSPVEDGETFVENALIKARAVSAATGLPSIADDSGLVVSALGGAPGIFSARYAGEAATDADTMPDCSTSWRLTRIEVLIFFAAWCSCDLPKIQRRSLPQADGTVRF